MMFGFEENEESEENEEIFLLLRLFVDRERSKTKSDVLGLLVL